MMLMMKMNKEKSNIKIKKMYDNKGKSFDRYIVLLDNNEVWSLGAVPKDFEEYLGTIGNPETEINSIKDVHNKGRKIPLKNIPPEIKDWLKKYNKIINEDDEK